MPAISNTPRPGYAYDSTDDVWYPIGTGPHTHADYITSGSAINPTIVDAKGDLIVATAADTVSRLAAGNNGETLVADSSTSTGLRYQENRNNNFIYNGNYDIWQRGTSFTSSGYGTDRWYNFINNITVSQQTTGAPAGARYYSRDTATGSGAYCSHYQYLETADVEQLQGKTVTVSIKMRRNATNTSGQVLVIQKSATVDAGGGASWTTISSVTVANGTIPTGTTSADWYTASVTAAIPNDGTANSIRVYTEYTVAVASGSIQEFSQAMLQIGSVVTPFQRMSGTIQGELAACQRYYFRTDSPNTYGCHSTTAFMLSSTAVYSITRLPVNLRVTPSSFDFSNIAFFNVADTKFALTSPTLNSAQSNTSHGIFTATITGGTANNAGRILSDNTTAGYIGFNAEL